MPDYISEILKHNAEINKDFDTMLWDDQTVATIIIPKMTKEEKSLYDSYDKYIERVDFLKIIILKLFGGIYVDVDLYFIKPIDEYILEKVFYICREKISMIGNAFIGSEANHPVLTELINLYISNKEYFHENILIEVLNKTGPKMITDFFDNSPYSIYVDSNHKLFYAMPWVSPKKYLKNGYPADIDSDKYQGSYAVHLWFGLWRSDIFML